MLTFALAWVLGAVTLKLSGHYLPLCTIAWGLSLYYLFGNMEFLGGQTGITGVPALVIGGLSLASPRALGRADLGGAAAGACGCCTTCSIRAKAAPCARSRAGGVMAESMGVDTARYRIKLFVLAALLAAISGWLYAHMQRFVNPTPFNLNIGIEYLFMAVVGGAGHLWGAVLGAALITLLKEKLQDMLPSLLGTSGNFEVIVFGLLMLLVLQRFAEGLWPTLARLGRALPAARAVTPAPRGVRAAGTAARCRPRGNVLLQADQRHQALRRPGRQQRGGDDAQGRRDACADRPERRRQEHLLQHDLGRGRSDRRRSAPDGPAHARASPRATSRRWAWAAPSSTCACSGSAACSRTWRSARTGARQRGWIASMLRLDRAEEAALLAEARRQIERCGLGAHADAPAASLALGQQRVVEIARALAGQPAVLLLDEPAAGLRHLEKQALAELLSQLRAEGLGILVVEHDMEFVMNLADRITVLEFGTVIAEGTPAEVQANPRVLDAYLGGGDDELMAAAA